MEVELRVILLIVGLVIFVIVGLDMYKRKSAKQVARKFMEPVVSDQVTAEFFDPEYADTVLETGQTSLAYEPIAYEPLSYEAVRTDLDVLESAIEEKNSEPQPVDNIICINVMSRDAYGFNGQNLLNALKSANMHFGKNDIFHRHENDDGSGKILFSVVSAVEPGYFFLDTMPQEHVPGITLFMLPSNLINPVVAFDKLVRTAKQMAFALNAELLDQDRQPLTLATIDKYRLLAKRK